MTAPTFPRFIKNKQINPEFSNFSVYQGWDDFRDQSVVCQDISKFRALLTIPRTFPYLSEFSVIPLSQFRVFVNNTTDISVLIGICRNSVIKVPCFVNNTTGISVLIGIFHNSVIKVRCLVNNTTDISVLIGIFRNSVNSVKVPCFVNLQCDSSVLILW